MRRFSDAELRLTKDDVIALFQYGLNNKIFGFAMDDHTVTNLTLHPDNKYVARLSLKGISKK